MYVLTLLSLLTVKTVLVGSAVFLLVMSLLQRKKYKLPPGPPQLPILGHYFAFRNEPRRYAVFNKLGESFDDIFTVNLGFGRLFVVLKSAESVHEAMVEKKEIFAGRDDESWKFELATEGFRDIAFADYGPVWRLQRQMALKAFRTYLASDKLEAFTRSAFDEVASLIEKETEPFDMDVHIRLLMFSIMSRMAFGKGFKLNDPDFVFVKDKLAEINRKLFSGPIASDVIPFLKHLPIPSSLLAKRLMKELIDFHKVQLELHETSLNKGNMRDITDHLLLLKEELTDESDDNVRESLSDTRILQTMMDIFLAGTQTTSDTLKWIIMYVADNPEVQAKIHKELDGLGKHYYACGY
ncbi:cytochrome P450 1A1 [Lingula anatina]|uniref:Cytochrome P450 1A1 n=1 Tax=Lingula anatina TaxID=7574 RepID=A0A1S3I5T4_LINAN|nr:cytochrome P450 1A1 [Lingula anatina]|eukprot:XP_013392734.1 cytochrome P450 1A1 [Lingula anatina]